MLDTPCVIFAGGKSSRMGEDKSLLPFASYKTLTQYQLDRLKKIFKTVYISCKSKEKFDFDAEFIEDIKTSKVYAPSVAFVSVFEALHVESFFALSVDSPFVDEKTIKTLIKKDKSNYDATIAKTNSGIQPLCGVYHISLLDDFKKMLDEDNHKLGYLLKNSNTNYVKFDDEEIFLNLNKPQDYQEALKLLKQ
jgi:molybdopterin-guanine dinucleotide biosynthesis protein A